MSIPTPQSAPKLAFARREVFYLVTRDHPALGIEKVKYKLSAGTELEDYLKLQAEAGIRIMEIEIHDVTILEAI